MKPSGINYKYQSHDGTRERIPDAIKIEADQALAEAKKGNFHASINVYKKIIQMCPAIGFLRNNRACCLASLEKFDEAETEFLEAIRIFSANRDKGIPIPRSCRRTTQRNLITLYKTILRTKQLIPPVTQRRKIQISLHTMSLIREIQLIARSIGRKGIVSALSKFPLYLTTRFNTALRWYEKVRSLRADEFDRKNNIDTAGIVYQSDLRVDNKNQSHAVYYQGSDSLFFHNAISSLRINFNEYTFIDFGSGKGKALFLASAFSFKKIIGIEFSGVLDGIARGNIRRFNKDNISVFSMDVVDYAIPGENLVCYFFDPFDGYIMAKVINNIRSAYRSYKKSILIVYYNPRFYALFDAENWLERQNHIGTVMIWSSKG
jgi:tetratricopeptide (TPR) repeat protein